MVLVVVVEFNNVIGVVVVVEFKPQRIVVVVMVVEFKQYNCGGRGI